MEPVPDFDLYAELEVSRTATTPTIDAAWRSLLKRNHPDLGGPQAAERTVRLNIAHDWLTDPVRRARYDEIRKAARRERARAAAERERERATARTGQDAGDAGARATGGGTRSARTPPAGARRTASVTVPGASRLSRFEAPGWMRTVRVDRRLLPIAAMIVVVAGGLWAVRSPTDPARTPGTAVPSPAGPTASSPAVVPNSSPRSGPDASGRSATPTPPGRVGPSAVPAPVLSLSGSGDRGKTRVELAGGTYAVDYVVTAPTGGSCPWAIYLTDSGGLDLLMASAYPVDETVRAQQRDAGVAPGPATVRVQSECPTWSVSITRTTP